MATRRSTGKPGALLDTNTPLDPPIYTFATAATNQMTTNATVAVIIDEVFDLARSFATPRHAAHSTKPTAMMIAVRIATSRRFLLVSEMVAEI
jgi:hypothetical protein